MSARGLPPGSIVDLYKRTSTKAQDELGDSDRTQEEIGRAVAERFGLVIGFVGDDGAESSKDLDRPDLQKILDRMRSGETRGIIVQHLDRLTRNLPDACALREEFFADPINGCWIYNDAGPVDTFTPDGEAFFYIQIVFSMLMRKKGAVRTRDTQRSKRKSSERISRSEFGKRLDPSNPARSKTGQPIAQVDDPVDAAALAVAQLLKLRGLSLQAIADKLTAYGFPTKRGAARWPTSTIAKLLDDHKPTGSLTDETYIDSVVLKVSIAGYYSLPIVTDLREKISPFDPGSSTTNDAIED